MLLRIYLLNTICAPSVHHLCTICAKLHSQCTDNAQIMHRQYGEGMEQEYLNHVIRGYKNLLNMDRLLGGCTLKEIKQESGEFSE